MPRSLVSYWKRVATSGPTVDGREILPQELRDIAETYAPSKFTAVIWCEHERWFGSHGTVFAVRLIEEGEDLDAGQVALEAQLKPNDRLLSLNDQGEKLFSSIEITPNFAGTGKAYLTGLAVTDSPASLGTQELYFSKKTGKDAYYGASVEIGPLSDDPPQGEMGKLTAMLASLFKRFSSDQPAPAANEPPTESKSPMDEATAKALKSLVEQQQAVTAGIQAMIEGNVKADSEQVADVQTAVDEVVTTAGEDKQLSQQSASNKAVLAAVAELDAKFNSLLDSPKGRHLPRTTGAADPQKVRVL